VSHGVGPGAVTGAVETVVAHCPVQARRRASTASDTMSSDPTATNGCTGAQLPSAPRMYRSWQRRRALAGGLIALGVVVVLTHVFVHLGNIEWLPTTGMQDLLTGCPMGGVLIVIGLSLLPRS
jgi:xanthine/uracil permease